MRRFILRLIGHLALFAYASIMILASILFSGCGYDYKVGQVVVKPLEATPWDDLDEELTRMQGTAGVPDDLFSTQLLLYPCDQPIPFAGEDAACSFDPGPGWISTRVCGPSAAEWSLAHEWAHRWDWLRGFPIDHSPRWAEKERILKGTSPHK